MCLLSFVDVRNTSISSKQENDIYEIFIGLDGVFLGVTDGVTVVYGDVIL